MSNLERQRKFRRSHPGYFRKYKRKPDKEAVRQHLMAVLAAAEKAEAEKAQQARQPLMLPAPAETPIIPGMTTPGALLAQGLLAASQPATTPGGRAIAA
jgi:hypothetical protein